SKTSSASCRATRRCHPTSDSLKSSSARHSSVSRYPPRTNCGSTCHCWRDGTNIVPVRFWQSAARICRPQPSATPAECWSTGFSLPNHSTIQIRSAHQAKAWTPTSFPQRGLAAEDVVVVLGKAVGFVAHVLQQAERVGMAAQTSRLFFSRDVHF